MTTETRLFRPLRKPHASVCAAILTALVAVAPIAAVADPPAATAADTRVADVSLADLNLSTSGGMRVARERVHAMAKRICAGQAEIAGLSSSPNFVACVDNTLTGALRNIRTLRPTNETTRHSVTRAANVSLADLNLSTPEGFRVAHERLEAMARRLCAELARGNDLSYQPNWAACVNDTIAGPLAQAKVLAAEKETRTARRLAP